MTDSKIVKVILKDEGMDEDTCETFGPVTLVREDGTHERFGGEAWLIYSEARAVADKHGAQFEVS